MTDATLPSSRRVLAGLGRHRVWAVTAALLALLALVAPGQAAASLGFMLDALLSVAPFLALSVAVAAGAGATGADNLIAKAFRGAPAMMIVTGALAGALSPFCSCGVIPLIAALLAIGVPIAPVMAFWLASPVMDPSMFVLTAGVLGTEFAVAKTLAAIGAGLLGGTVAHLLAQSGALENALRPEIGNGGCGGAKIRAPRPVVWRFWTDPERRAKFAREGWKSSEFLLRWLTLAFLLESLMVAWLPPEVVTSALGGTGLGPIAVATAVGVPAYLNGYAALPLVGGLIGQGMAPGAGLAFLVAGGITSLPAALAVWALVRPPAFALYAGLALTSAFLAGVSYQLWLGL